MTVTATTGKTVYKASGGRKTALTLFLLLVMPFFISLPFIIGMRVSRGLISDSVPLIVAALVIGVSLALMLSHVIYSYRTRIELGDTGVKMTVPDWKGPTPGLRYVKHEIPYDQIARIETRGEVYRELAVPSMMRASTVLTKTGQRIHLGYSHETSEDPAIPVTEIAARIAERAGVEVREKESIRVGSQYKAMLKGTPAWDTADDETEGHRRVTGDDYAKLIQSNHKYMFYLAFVVMGLALIALVVDLGRSGFLN